MNGRQSAELSLSNIVWPFTVKAYSKAFKYPWLHRQCNAYFALPNKHNLNQCSAEAVACFFVSFQLCVPASCTVMSITDLVSNDATKLQKPATKQPMSSSKTNTDALLIANIQSRPEHSWWRWSRKPVVRTRLWALFYRLQIFLNSSRFKTPLSLLQLHRC